MTVKRLFKQKHFWKFSFLTLVVFNLLNCSPDAKKCQKWLVTCASDAGPVFARCVKTMAVSVTKC